MNKHTTYLLLLIVLSFNNTFSQCNEIETLSICDMTQIDFNNDGVNDGIINLYDEYNALPGVTPISNTVGEWYDPNFNFALDTTNGNLNIWDLNSSSTSTSTYQFQLIDTNSTCTDGILINFNIVVGAFSGFSVPTNGTDDVNIEICDTTEDNGCETATYFDLFHTLLSTPSAHSNGTWTYEGSSSNFISIEEGRFLVVNIPYQAGPPLIDDEIFELKYTVEGINPCNSTMETSVKVAVVRGVFSGANIEGYASRTNICELELLLGNYDNINLLNDEFLVGEDIEGTWYSEEDPTNQISAPNDSQVNLSEVYQDLLISNPRFGCQSYSYTYTVESRSALCSNMESTVEFTFYEYIRPFLQVYPKSICIEHETSSTLSLYSLIGFASENGVIYDYPYKESYTDWTFVSGPSSLELTPEGNIDISNLTNADAGTYTFQYLVDAEYNCDTQEEMYFLEPNGCISFTDSTPPCVGGFSTQVVVNIYPYNYPGENTSVELCESDLSNPINLTNLLETNGVDSIYLGPDSYWYNQDTDETINNPFNFSEIEGAQTFHLQYRINANDCAEQANLTLTIYQQYEAGSNAVIDVCIEDSNFELFDYLNGVPDDNGSWEGPDGFISTSNSVDFHPDTFESGDYIYTVPSNGNCDEQSATVTVNIHPLSNAGDYVEAIVCKLDNQVDLFDLLDSDADTGGTFIDLDNTNALSGSMVDLSILTNASYNFQYEVQPNAACVLASSVITLVVNDVSIPTVSDQSFCMGYGATIADLEVITNQDYYNWYADNSGMSTLDSNLILQNGEDYFVTAVNENDCESERVKITVTLIEFGLEGCVSCVNDGVSANGDNENDSLEICDLPSIFPNFEIKIFNRYGNTIYTGNINTPLFDGTSNVSLTLGDQVPAGVYFYIFNPNDGVTKPFQGDFYLSR